jgi:hypothetical protein
LATATFRLLLTFIWLPTCMPTPTHPSPGSLNLFLWATGSSGAIPLGFFFSIIFLW